MKSKLFFSLLSLVAAIVLGACGAPPEAEQATRIAGEIYGTQTAEAAQATKVAADVFATQTAEAPPPTATGTPTDTPTNTPAATATLVPTETPTPTLTLTPTVAATPTPAATAVPTRTPLPTATPTPARNWVLVADSQADFPGPIQDRRWWYLWSKGRRNFFWEDMSEMPNQCYHSPNELGLEICRDTITYDGRGDAGVQWKAKEGGNYLFEWKADEAPLDFWRHTTQVRSQGPGPTFPNSVIMDGVVDWELFFWVSTGDSPYHIKVYKEQK
jgi:hypothetical protein